MNAGKAPRKKFHVNSAKIVEAICLHGLPPKRQRGALCAPEGYWGIIAKEVSQKQKPSQGYVKCGYNYTGS